MPDESEMMADLAAADAAGDAQLAQHIAGAIKAGRSPSVGQRVTNAAQAAGVAPSMSIGDRLKNAVHLTAGQLPAAGAIGGGALGAGLGGAIGLPTTGPGAILTAIAGGATGAGLGSAGGKALQRAIDVALGYEKDPGIIETVKDSALTGGKDAAMTGAGGMLVQALSAAAKPVAGALEKGAISTTRRILRNVGGSISAKKTLPDDAAREVLDEGIIKPLGTSEGAAARLETAREASGDRYRQIVETLEKNGITGPDAQALAQKYAAQEATASANSMNPSATGVYGRAAEQLAEKPTVAGRLSLTQTENLKRSLQDQAKAAYKQMQPGEVGQANEDAASMMRQAAEDEIAAQSQSNRAMRRNPAVQEAAAQFEPVKQQTGRLIQASNVAREGASRAANRNAISLTDMLMASGGYAHHGNPLEAAAVGVGAHLLRTRGPSTFAWGAHGLADLLADAPPVDPASAARLATLISLLAQNNKSEAPE